MRYISGQVDMTRPVDFEQFRLGGASIERRERRPVAMRAFIATQEGATAEALVLDLSYDGCGIETPLPLTVGQDLTLSVEGRRVVRASVRWWSDGRGGLVFQIKDGEEGAQQPRADKRVELKFEAALRRLGMGSYHVNVSDLSPRGCKVELVERPRVGEHVLLKFDHMEAIEAEVCWLQEHDAGLRFVRPIHDSVYALMIRRLTDGSC